jgi:hypothetical protein
MRERRSRPAQTKVPALKGLACEEAEKKLHAANLNIRLLATRYDSAVQPRFIIDQTPTHLGGSSCGYSVGLTVSRRDLAGPDINSNGNALDQISDTLRSCVPASLSLNRRRDQFRRLSGDTEVHVIISSEDLRIR